MIYYDSTVTITQSIILGIIILLGVMWDDIQLYDQYLIYTVRFFKHMPIH